MINGVIQNAEFHTLRFRESFNKFFWKPPNFDLFEAIKIPKEHQSGKVKLRISFNETGTSYTLEAYETKVIESLRLVHHNSIDYDLKFQDRSELEMLYSQKKECDDILIIRNGWVTDCSYANIVFWDGSDWYTPATYLLNGTKRMNLLKHEAIKELSIGFEDLTTFKGFQLINAMLDFNPSKILPIHNIKS